jgi:hypothetical protein
MHEMWVISNKFTKRHGMALGGLVSVMPIGEINLQKTST